MNSNKVIRRGVVNAGHTYLPGEEDELDAVLSPDEAKRLIANGTLEGNWTGKGKPEPTEQQRLRQDLEHSKNLPPTVRSIYLEHLRTTWERRVQETIRFISPSYSSARYDQKRKDAEYNLWCVDEIVAEIKRQSEQLVTSPNGQQPHATARGGSESEYPRLRPELQQHLETVYPLWKASAQGDPDARRKLKAEQPLLLAHSLNEDMPEGAPATYRTAILNLPRESRVLALQHAANLCGVPLCSRSVRQLQRILNPKS